ncbi:MAG: hypothetical protein Q9223_006797 [Gallowayella weberi]
MPLVTATTSLILGTMTVPTTTATTATAATPSTTCAGQVISPPARPLTCNALAQQYGVATGDLTVLTNDWACQFTSPICAPLACETIKVGWGETWYVRTHTTGLPLLNLQIEANPCGSPSPLHPTTSRPLSSQPGIGELSACATKYGAISTYAKDLQAAFTRHRLQSTRPQPRQPTTALVGPGHHTVARATATPEVWYSPTSPQPMLTFDQPVPGPNKASLKTAPAGLRTMTGFAVIQHGVNAVPHQDTAATRPLIAIPATA